MSVLKLNVVEKCMLDLFISATSTPIGKRTTKNKKIVNKQ